MNKLPGHLLNHIFHFFHKFYRPWLRLVCRRWSKLIVERMCRIASIVATSPEISPRLWFEFENYVPLKSSVYFKVLCCKTGSPNKIQQLKLALDIGIPPCLDQNIFSFTDLATVKFLIELGIYFPSAVNPTVEWSIKTKDVDLINFFVDHGILLYNNEKVDLQHIDRLPLNNKFYAYVQHGYFPRSYMPSKLNFNSLFSNALKSQRLDLIEFLYNEYSEIRITTYYYYLVRQNVEITQYLYGCSRQTKLYPPGLRRLNRIPHLKELIKRKYWYPSTQDYSWAIIYGYDDVLKFLDWYNPAPKSDLLDDVVDYWTQHIQNIFVGITKETLQWCLDKGLVLSEKFVTHMNTNLNGASLEFFVEHNLKLTSDCYIPALKYCNYEMFDRLFELGIMAKSSLNLKLWLKRRGSDKVMNFFRTHFDIHVN